jgi:predicted PurR-regulated permease PerM
MDNPNINNSIYDITIRLFILILIIVWCLLIMSPFLSIMLWSLILSLAMHPLHKFLTQKLNGRAKMASVIIVLTFLTIIILPLSLLTISLITELKVLKTNYDLGLLTLPSPNEKVKEWPIIGEKLYSIWSEAALNLKDLILKYKDQLIDTGSNLAKGLLSAVGSLMQIIISLIIAGVLLVVGGVGDSVRKIFRKLAGNRGDEFADMTLKTVNSVVKGVIGVALILAALNGLIFAFAGIPYAGILTLIILVLCILQLPAFFVTLPVIIYMFSEKEFKTAVIWTILLIVAGLSDNILKPILLGKGSPVPILVIFIGVIGGFIISGFIGLFTGAIIMSFGYKLLVSWINTPEEAKI